MNKTLKHILEFLAILIVTFIVTLSSPLNPWINNPFTAMQSQILDIAHSVRDGYLAYVELDGHYGPVIYEFFGLGYLLTESHFIQFIMENVIVFLAVLFLYKTAKLYTVPVLAWVAAGSLAIFEWGELSHAGAEEFVFFIISLSTYHIARQLKYGYLPHHTYLLAIDLGIIFFIQSGLTVFWLILIIFFAVKFKIDGVEGKEYRSFWFSTFEGLLTVCIPLGLYLWYFKNAGAFFEQVVVYNINNMGSFADGIKLICGTPWALLIPVLVIVLIIKLFMEDEVMDLGCWLIIMIVAIIVLALQGDNLSSYLEVMKALYIVPVASIFSLVGRPFGLEPEQRTQ